MENDNESPIIERLRQYIKASGLTSTQFADKAGIPRPSFSQILSGRNKTISNQIISKLHNSFPDLDILWLLFGQPTVQTSSNIEISEPQNDQVEQKTNDVAAEPKWQAAVLCTPPEEDTTKADDASVRTDSNTLSATREVKSILVIYTDGSFESFSPTPLSSSEQK